MIKIDIRLKSEEMNTLHALIGKRLESIQHDPFNFVNASSHADVTKELKKSEFKELDSIFR
mgnify:CR=1 FL=1